MANPLLNTKIQFLAIVFAIIICTAWLANSPAANVLGKTTIAFLGLLLLVFVVFVFAELFWKTSAGKKKGERERDLLDEVSKHADPRAVSKLIEVKYGGRAREEAPSFEELYAVKKEKKKRK